MNDILPSYSYIIDAIKKKIYFDTYSAIVKIKYI